MTYNNDKLIQLHNRGYIRTDILWDPSRHVGHVLHQYTFDESITYKYGPSCYFVRTLTLCQLWLFDIFYIGQKMPELEVKFREHRYCWCWKGQHEVHQQDGACEKGKEKK